jgi:hypothetical protein
MIWLQLYMYMYNTVTMVTTDQIRQYRNATDGKVQPWSNTKMEKKRSAD